MNFYPYSAPIILSDIIFFGYGGHRGSSSPEQRQSAYFIAELAASEDINTFLLPTIVTGTHIYNHTNKYILEHGYINQLIETRFIDKNETTYLTKSGVNNSYVGLVDDERGMAIAFDWGYDPTLYKIQFVYNTGLPSGTSLRPDVLLGLVTYADIILNEIQGYGNEAPGDVGVQQYQNQQYRESRVGLLRTTFGTSARANFAHNLFTKLRKYRQVGL